MRHQEVEYGDTNTCAARVEQLCNTALLMLHWFKTQCSAFPACNVLPRQVSTPKSLSPQQKKKKNEQKNPITCLCSVNPRDLTPFLSQKEKKIEWYGPEKWRDPWLDYHNSEKCSADRNQPGRLTDRCAFNPRWSVVRSDDARLVSLSFSRHTYLSHQSTAEEES